MPQFPSFMRIPDALLSATSFVIPKFHIYAHGKSCQSRFSLNFKKWSARTNGEDIERWWSHINPVSMSTKEMGPGSRHDTIDDHAAAWNWRKIIGFGTCMLYMGGDYLLMSSIRQVASRTTSQSNQNACETPGAIHENQCEVFSASR
jgi:hypothetical protein